MEYFSEKQGTYIYAGGSLGTVRKVITFSMFTSLIVIIGISLFLWVSMKNSAGNVDPIAPFIPLFTLPGTMLALFFVRRRVGSLGTIRVDYMNGKVTFGLVTSGTMSRKEIPTASIRRISLSPAGSSIYRHELSGGGYWAVGMETGEGSFQLVTLKDHEAAAGLGRELSSLISVPFDDRQN